LQFAPDRNDLAEGPGDQNLDARSLRTAVLRTRGGATLGAGAAWGEAPARASGPRRRPRRCSRRRARSEQL